MNSRAIFPDRLAQFCAARAGEKYRPHNGVEGELFIDAWCRNCVRATHAGMEPLEFDASACLIVGATFAYTIEDAQYPKEWQYAQDGQPCCTAFVRVGEAIPAPRCERTSDLFDRDAS